MLRVRHGAAGGEKAELALRTMVAGPEGASFGRRARRLLLAAGCALVAANCASNAPQRAASGPQVDPRYGVAPSPRVIAEGEPVPKGGGRYMVGKPYTIGGRTYVPSERRTGHAGVGTASWYGSAFHGRLTANGEVFDRESVMAAHPTMPLPSYARVTNLRNNRSLVVRVNDRGPYHADRVIDVSERAAEALDFRRVGTASVKVEYVGRANLAGSDDRKLLATLREDGPARLTPAPSPVTMLASARPATPAPAPRRGADPVEDDEEETPAEVTRATAPPRPAPRPTRLASLAAAEEPSDDAPRPPSRPRLLASGLGEPPRAALALVPARPRGQSSAMAGLQ